MEILCYIVVFIYLIGFVVFFGVWVVQVFGGKCQIIRIMDYGLVIVGVVGFVLVVLWGIEYDLNYVKIGVKFVVLLIIGVLLGIGFVCQKCGVVVFFVVFWFIGIFVLLNVGFVVIWC